MKGRDKLLETLNGVPLLRRQVLAAMTTGCPVAVTLRDADAERRAALAEVPVHIEPMPDAGEGMAASLRRAVGMLIDGQSLGVLLPDVPGMAGSDIGVVLEAFRGGSEQRVTRASDPEGRPGTPLFLPHSVARLFAGLRGDEGGRGVLKGREVELVRFDDDRATIDLDTPEDWAAWRGASGIPE